MKRVSAKATVLALAIALCAPNPAQPASPDRPTTTDLIIVGSGIAGLSAALEAGRADATVIVIDMGSVFGGHAVMSGGDVTLVDTPLQRAEGVHDSPRIAYEDFINWGGDNNRPWVRYYVDHSSEDIHGWLSRLGVKFEGLRSYPGNRVPRAHITSGRGLGLVAPIYRACLLHPNVHFLWNTQVTDLVSDSGNIVGVRARNLRTGAPADIRAKAVLLATGGFQSNLDVVRAHWPAGSPLPARLLVGSGINSTGSGLSLAARAGASVSRLDHQWNYERGLPDPRYPGAERGLNAGVEGSIWVNAQAQRFVNEDASSPETLKALLAQTPATYWAIFDDDVEDRIGVTGTGWDDASIKQWIEGDSAVMKGAASLEQLAATLGLSASALQATVIRWNSMVEQGRDPDFGRSQFGHARKIQKPPFHALQFFPMTRKSMGGIDIDTAGHAIDAEGHPVAGLYAAGEATGLAGINGRAALEGTFLGPSVLTGRIAARSAVGQSRVTTVKTRQEQVIDAASMRDGAVVSDYPGPPDGVASTGCRSCHAIDQLASQNRPGYWHFEKSHQWVNDKKLECVFCHSPANHTSAAATNLTERLSQSYACTTCHASP